MVYHGLCNQNEAHRDLLHASSFLEPLRECNHVQTSGHIQWRYMSLFWGRASGAGRKNHGFKD